MWSSHCHVGNCHVGKWSSHCHFSALLNSSKNCKIGNFVKQNIISHGNFEGIGDLGARASRLNLCCANHHWIAQLTKMASLLNTFSMLIQVCATTWVPSLFNVCLMHGNIPQECMQAVIVPICKNKKGNIRDAGNYRPVSLETIISKLFEHYILSCISPLGPQQTISLASSQNMARICAFFYVLLCKQRYTSVFSFLRCVW